MLKNIQTYFMKEFFTIFEELPDSDLVTRELGMRAYDILKQVIMQTEAGAILQFDFSDVLVMDSSFAGPSLLRLMRELVDGQYGDKYLVISNATSSTEENVDLTIRGHGLKLAIPSLNEDDTVTLLGEIEPNLLHTFGLVLQKKIMTARELADLEQIGISAASNRLKKLSDLRLVTRTEEVTIEGRQHRYHALMI